ncbi:MAG: hypothetical protein AAGH64_00755 [Planctomycetota bacterium]
MVTTQESSSSKPLGPLLPLAGLVLALAVALGVWLLPDGMIDPEAKAIVTRPTQNAQQAETWDPIEPDTWGVLTANFEALREPDRDPEPPPPPPPGGDEPTQVQTTPPRGGQSVRPPWSYEGVIREPRGTVAVIRTERGQRLVYVGDVITHTDPRGRSGVDWTVVEATSERLLLRHEQEEYEFQMLRIGTSEMPGGRNLPQTRNRTATPRPAVPPREVGEG